jgi:hypothetical protein
MDNVFDSPRERNNLLRERVGGVKNFFFSAACDDLIDGIVDELGGPNGF